MTATAITATRHYCSECDERAEFLGGEWVHVRDAEPLCPIVGDLGYEACEPYTLEVLRGYERR